MPSFDEVTRAVGKVRVTDRIPYTGAGVDSLTAQIGAILKVEKDAQRIILDVTKDYIHVEKLAKITVDKDEFQERLDTLIRSVQMRESVPEKPMPRFEYVHHLFRQVTDEGLEVALILVGNLTTLEKWIPMSAKSPRLFGVRVARVKNVPAELILVCGAEWHEAEIEDIRFTVKGVMQ